MKNGINTLVLSEMYLFAMQNGNYCDLCLAVNGFCITFASEYIFYVKLVMDNVVIYKIGVFKIKRGKETSIIRDNNIRREDI